MRDSECSRRLAGFRRRNDVALWSYANVKSDSYPQTPLHESEEIHKVCLLLLCQMTAFFNISIPWAW